MNKINLSCFVERDRMELMLRAPFYGRIICSSEIVFVRDPRVRLACTDYRHIFLSADSYPELPEEQRLAVLAHEVLHIALRHAFRIGNRDRERFSTAADIEIHFLLRDTFRDPYKIPCKEAWNGLTAEQIYNLLPGTSPQPKSDHCYPGDQMKNLHGTPQSEAGDEVPSQEEGSKAPGAKPGTPDAADMQAQKGADGESRGTGPVPKRAPGADHPGDGISEFCPQFDADSEMDCRMLSEGTMLDMKHWEGRGNVPSGMELLVEKLAKTRLNWRVLLRQFIRIFRGGTYCWLPPNRRFVAKGIYLPGRRDKFFRGVAALDTSGSTMDVLSDFVAELANLLRSFGRFELTVIECDAKIHRVWKIDQYDKAVDLRKHKFRGGGGTDFTPVFEYVHQHIRNPNVLIFFTDGDGKCPEEQPTYPILWLLTKEGKSPVNWGCKIHYGED